MRHNGYMPILIVEDDDIDAEALTRSFTKQQLKNPIYMARDGVEAMQMLDGTGAFPAIPQPCLIILDLNMPRMKGLEFLDELQKTSRLFGNVVLVLTTSGRDEDKRRAYGNHVAGYFLKENLPQLTEMVSHYCRINELPGHHSGAAQGG